MERKLQELNIQRFGSDVDINEMEIDEVVAWLDNLTPNDNLSSLKKDLKDLVANLQALETKFHGSTASGTNKGINQIYRNYSNLIGSVDNSSGYSYGTGVWAVLKEITDNYDNMYDNLKYMQEIQSELDAFNRD